jgi:hypothetical protein
VICLTGFTLAWMLFSLSAVAADDGLVAWWKFDEGKGNKTLLMLKDKERPRNPTGLDSQQWCYSKNEQLYYGPNDKQ